MQQISDQTINPTRLKAFTPPLKMVQAILDLAILCSAFTVAYFLRFDFAPQPVELKKMTIQLLFIVPLQMIVLHFCGINKFIWRYTSLRETRQILAAFAVAALPVLILRLFLHSILPIAAVPVSIVILDFCLAAMGILGIRFLRREIYEYSGRRKTVSRSMRKKPVLLVGAGQAGVLTLAEIKRRGDIDLEVRGFIDDDPVKRGASINGVKVLGGADQLPELVEKHNIDHVIISITQASREEIQRILQICRTAGVRVRTIPGIYELLQEKVSFSRIRDIEIDDLLGRSPVQIEQTSVVDFLRQKVVMVTGAGGSIGSELVRQIARCETGKLVLVERSEFALFQIEREIVENFPELEFHAVIADICDERRMECVFRRFAPQVVFHAAAHKHVPMMENNASEAIKNNVFGTRLTADLAGKFNAEAFVLISSDKAVRPKSVMGATKRAAELVIQNLDRKYETHFVAVRFGNVIGSSGSVIPTFREQIKRGGPVTVTHPDMVRFFMTIPEATQLVLQAGAFGRGGEIFILDMGKPVRILDLAKETIRLSGLEPDVDIKIVFTGIRPGEKMVEELESDAEKLYQTDHPKIFLGKITAYSSNQVEEMLVAFSELCDTENNDLIREVLTRYLPESKIGHQLNQELKVPAFAEGEIPSLRPKILAVSG